MRIKPFTNPDREPKPTSGFERGGLEKVSNEGRVDLIGEESLCVFQPGVERPKLRFCFLFCKTGKPEGQVGGAFRKEVS